jgi:Zn-dependent peptidase ImmA (M78 family)
MDKTIIKIEHLPTLRNLRTLSHSIAIDDSALNIAIADLIRSCNFLYSTEAELGLENAPVLLPSISSSDSPSDVSATIRSFFDLKLDEQYKFNSSRKFYLYLRQKIEGKVIFINCFTDIEVEMVRGIAMWDGDIPIIGINAKDRPPAKSFSIIHELVHIINHQSALCNEMVSSFSTQQEEVFCNAVAGETLVPEIALGALLTAKMITKFTLEDIKAIAKKFCVSREVIVRRLYDTGYFTKDEYDTYSSEIKRELESEKEIEKTKRQEGIEKGIPRNPSREAVDKNSSAICHALFIGYGDGLFSKQDVSGLLGIKEKYIPAFISEVGRW